jgi:hypothetical protein
MEETENNGQRTRDQRLNAANFRNVEPKTMIDGP